MSAAPGGARATGGEASERVRAALSGRLGRRAVVRRAAGLGALASASAALKVSPRAAAQGTPVATPGAPRLRLGAVFNLTGEQSSLDVPARDGALLATKEIDAAGGVLGRPLELLVADGRTDPTAVAAAARTLIEADGVPVILGLSDTSSALPVADVAQAAAVPFLTTGATAPAITAVGDFVFMLPFGDNVQAAVAAEYARERGWTTCGLMVDAGMDFTKLLAAYFVDRFDDPDIGGSVLGEASYATGDTDFSAPLTDLLNLDPQPDFLFVSSGPQEIGTIVKQARDLGIRLPIVGGDGYDTPLLLEQAGEAANGVFFTTHQGVYGDEPAARAFRAAFATEYGGPPPSVFAALGYDGVKLVADAIDRAGRAEPEAIRDALASTQDFAGVTGTVTYQPGTRIPAKGCALIEVEGGRFTLIENVTPTKVPPA